MARVRLFVGQALSLPNHRQVWLSQASEEQGSAASFVFSTLVSQFEGE